MTFLAVAIQVKNAAQTSAAIASAISGGAEMLELRLDYLENPTLQAVAGIISHARQSGLPVIATCRPDWEGGKFSGGEQERLQILKEAARVGADYIDIEMLADAGESFDGAGVRQIISNHDFEQLPGDFAERWAKIRQRRPAVAKIAYMARHIDDCFAGLDMLRQYPGSIALAMGQEGLISRLLAKKLNGFLTFAGLDEDTNTAPGQISLEQFKTLYRWDKINADTKIYGVIGCPIGHSKSPLIHNAAFTATDFNGLYLPMLVEDSFERFSALLDGIRQRWWLDVGGFSVTIPHKHNALRYIQENQGHIEPPAEKIGAVNTILLDDNGMPSGFNTDYAGAMDAITNTLGIKKTDLRALPVAVIGAGGVARALVAGLTDAGAEVTIYNRTGQKAQILARQFGCSWWGLEQLSQLKAKLIVNCTSIGMYPHIDNSPIPAEVIKPEMVVFDTVYNPAETKLLKLARQAGASTITGQEMFLNQAALQFKMFTHKEPPLSVMREIIAS
jgi:3-dehydroquinate dehydratase/shikimate dehydrogenase